MTSTTVTDQRRRRSAFLDELYLTHWKLNSTNDALVSEARRVLAALRRGLTEQGPQRFAYSLLLPQEPTDKEVPAWMLTAGLFGLHPQGRPPGGRPSRTFGATMHALAVASGTSAEGRRHGALERRFHQLISVDHRALPHHLRQAVQLARSGGAAVDYGRLLDDLVVLLDEEAREESVRRVRLSWARDYHRPHRDAATPDEEGDQPSASDTEN